jgi:hypothetical protein
MWETFFLPLVGKYPWRCGFCRTRVSLKDRGTQHQYVQSESPAPSDSKAESF